MPPYNANILRRFRHRYFDSDNHDPYWIPIIPSCPFDDADACCVFESSPSRIAASVLALQHNLEICKRQDLQRLSILPSWTELVVMVAMWVWAAVRARQRNLEICKGS